MIKALVVQKPNKVRNRKKEKKHILWHINKGWFTLATESEAESESEAQGALWSSVNQKSES